MNRIVTREELLDLEVGTLLRGPDWHSEVYLKTGEDEFLSPGSEHPWDSFNLEPRGSFEILKGIDSISIEEYLGISDLIGGE